MEEQGYFEHDLIQALLGDDKWGDRHQIWAKLRVIQGNDPY